MHIFKPGDMALIITCCVFPELVGKHCIVDSHPYTLGMRSLETGKPYDITAVDVTTSHPQICKSNIVCLQYVPPDEWPSVFKVKELVPIENKEPLGEPA